MVCAIKDGKPSLVGDATARATIVVGGRCTPSADSGGSFEITGRRLKIVGSASGATLEGNGQRPVVRVPANASVELNNLTIAFGGGAVGAGVLNQGSATLRGSTVTNNRALGGGAGIWNEGVMSLDRSTVSHNVDRNGRGGGIHNVGRLTISRSSILNNSSYGSGGGLYNAGNAKISSSTLSGNSTRLGGGITNERSGTLALRGSTISHNIAYDERGGGVANLGGTVSGACPPSTSYVANSAPADPSTDDRAGIDCG